jgi:predicted metalloprotease
MRFGNRRVSGNVESRSGGSRFGGGGFGGGGMLLGLVFSRFGLGGVVVLVLAMMLLGDPIGLTGGGQQVASPDRAGLPAAQGQAACETNPDRRFLCQVLASTEDHWGQMFTASGASYAPPTLVFYQGGTQTGCGYGQATMGPFYCPADRNIFIDTTFFDELARRYGAPGDFAQAYVLAHEVGHHVQTIGGTSDAIRRAQSGAGEAAANALQVRMELQADCYAGVWASRERGAAMEPGDLEEGMAAAAAIGDDRLQRAGQGYVVPESFTHGSSAQRQEALMRGWRGGDPSACAAYTTGL